MGAWCRSGAMLVSAMALVGINDYFGAKNSLEYSKS